MNRRPALLKLSTMVVGIVLGGCNVARPEAAAPTCRVDLWYPGDGPKYAKFVDPTCELLPDPKSGTLHLVIAERHLMPRVSDSNFQGSMDLITISLPHDLFPTSCGSTWTPAEKAEVAWLWTTGSPIGGGPRPLARRSVWCLDASPSFYLQVDGGSFAAVIRVLRPASGLGNPSPTVSSTAASTSAP